MKQRMISRLLLVFVIAVLAILIPKTLHAAPAGPGDWSKVRLFGHAFRNDDYTPDQYDFIRDNFYIFTIEKRHAKNIYGATSTETAAAEYLRKASGHWRRYAAVASSQYNPQLLARVGWMDWKELYPDVLRDIELMGGTSRPPSLDPTPGGTLLEAEQAATKGGVTQASIKGYTGTGYVHLGKSDSAITFTYDAPAAGEYMLEFRYVLESGDRDMAVLINGTPEGTSNFWSTGGPSSWAWDRKTVRLNSGSNAITLKSPDIGPKVDHVNVLRP